MAKQIFIVGFAGGIGSIARFLCQKYIYAFSPHPFPFGTFLVNILGCLLIGIFYAIAEKGNLSSPEMRLLLMTGFCGGFTTFSSFSLENITLLRAGEYLYFLLYTLGSVVLGFLATFFAIAMVK